MVYINSIYLHTELQPVHIQIHGYTYTERLAYTNVHSVPLLGFGSTGWVGEADRVAADSERSLCWVLQQA